MSGPYFLASGRWDNVVSIIDLAAALDPANDGTAKAIVARPRVTPDIDDDGRGRTPASGQPVSLAVPRDGRFAYVVNHSGTVTPAAAFAFQHGHPGTITILDLAKAFDPANGGTTNAIAGIVPTGTAGPVGIALTPDQKTLVVASAEAAGLEDGGRQISLIDVASRKVLRQIVQDVEGSGSTLSLQPCALPSPNAGFGRFPNSNGVAVTPFAGGAIFTANGGTDDVSVISLPRALAGDAETEVARIPVETGGFGIAASPDGRLVAVASRESARTGKEGNTISLIDVERAIGGGRDAEVARIRIGTDDASEGTRPFAVAFTRDGSKVLASCFRSNTLSLVDVAAALGGNAAEEKRLRLSTAGGRPGRPRGIAITPDGRYAGVTGGPKEGPGSSTLFVIDIKRMQPAGCVTGVGNESYLLDILPKRPD
jgi:DNA-binding beta-propeller fold protein YncE